MLRSGDGVYVLLEDLGSSIPDSRDGIGKTGKRARLRLAMAVWAVWARGEGGQDKTFA